MVEIQLKKRSQKSIAKMLKRAEREEKKQSIPNGWGRAYRFTMPMFQTVLSTETWDSNT